MIELIFPGQENEARSSNQFNGLNFQKVWFLQKPKFFILVLNAVLAYSMNGSSFTVETFLGVP